jgi:hypothetical protein
MSADPLGCAKDSVSSMLICNDIELTSWTPNFSSSGQANPQWTWVSCDGLQLANSVEWVDWATNPVQVVLCDACGYPDCGQGNYVHVSRLGDFIIWSTPHIDQSDDWSVSQYTPSLAVRKHGAVAFPKAEWARLRTLNDGVPSHAVLAEATRRVLADSWRLSASGPARVDSFAHVIPMLKGRLLATDRFEPDETIRILTPLLDWLSEAPDEPLSGTLCDPQSVDAQIEVLYFDGPREHDWPAFALLGRSPVLALSRDIVFVPESAA